MPTKIDYVPSEYDVEMLPQLLRGLGDWFGADLFRLIAKADPGNRERLREGFPLAVGVYEDWLEHCERIGSE